MIDYTPTTKDIQQAWIAVQLGKPEATAEFARWLADVKAEAWEEGRRVWLPSAPPTT